MSTQPKLCPQCGTAQDESAPKCSRCGHDFSSQPMPSSKPTVSVNSTSKWDLLNRWGVLSILAVVVIGGCYLAYSFAIGHPLAGTWLASESFGTDGKMILRKDGTGEFQSTAVSNGTPTSFRPFKWHTEGSFLFFDPLEASDSAPTTAQPYRMYDSNRYLSVSVNGQASTWRREEK